MPDSIRHPEISSVLFTGFRLPPEWQVASRHRRTCFAWRRGVSTIPERDTKSQELKITNLVSSGRPPMGNGHDEGWRNSD